MERLGRGVVALRRSSSEVLVTWRLLGLDDAAIAFNVYRSSAGGEAVRLNAAPLDGATSFLDRSATLSAANTYTVRPVLGGVEQAASGGFTLGANHAVEPVVRVKLDAPPGVGYRTKFVWVGDLDGDGEYDYVIDRLAPLDASDDNIGLGNQYLEAYRRDGTRLWRIDLGPSSRETYNVSPGAATLSMGMWDGVTVYDLDGNGKAEVILKIADGVIFNDGSTFRDSDPERQFIAVIDGLSGKPLATRAFPATFQERGPLATQLGVGYPDGVTPAVYFWGRNRNADKSFNDVFATWSWSGGSSIDQKWLLTTNDMPPVQASHQMRIVDVDGDGKDEFATGNFVINSGGTLRYVIPGVVHGDRFYIGKMDPSSPGLQGYGVQQNNPSTLLEYYYDAGSGKIRWSTYGAPGSISDIGRGLASDVDPRMPGFEAWSFSGLKRGVDGALAEPDNGLYPYPSHAIWWDGDVLGEGLNDSRIEKWNPLAPRASNRVPRLLNLASHGAVIHGHNPMFYGDILGDWRTEIVTLNATHSELVVFSTDMPTEVRAYTMAHNPAYRNHMTVKGYMQSPMLDYYFGAGMSAPPPPAIRYAGSGG